MQDGVRSLPIIWEGQVWRSEARGTWGDGREVVVLQLGRTKVRVRNLKSGLRTWIGREFFDNPENLYVPPDREFWMAQDDLDEYFEDMASSEGIEIAKKRKNSIPQYEYLLLMNSAKKAKNQRSSIG